MTAAPQGFPQVGLPIAGPNGQVTQTWLQLFVSLWQRTGGGQGGGFAPPSGAYVVKNADSNIPNAYVATNTATVDWDLTSPGIAKLNVNQGALTLNESQVANLTTDLAARALTATTITAGTGLTGGGSLATNRTVAIAANGVTNALLATAAADTFKGNPTGIMAAPTDMTATQATALLNPFTTALQGLVPASGGGTVKYLRADASFANPLAGGVSGTVTLAKITGGGANGSLTVANGLITAIVNPT